MREREREGERKEDIKCARERIRERQRVTGRERECVRGREIRYFFVCESDGDLKKER